MSSYPNAHAIASMHLEPAAPVYNTLPCCDSMQMSHARCHTGTRHELSHSATWCCSPMKTWTPLPAAMRRMQVQVRRIVACVMPPVFYLRRPACGHAGGRDSKEQELRRTGSAVLALIKGRKANRNVAIPSMRCASNVNDRCHRRNGLRAARMWRQRRWHDCIQ